MDTMVKDAKHPSPSDELTMLLDRVSQTDTADLSVEDAEELLGALLVTMLYEEADRNVERDSYSS